MAATFETIMLICFGLSWPISVVKSIKSKSTEGKSMIFMIVIIVGYIAGISGKLVAGNITYVLALYCLNLIIVSLDLVIYFINKKNENQTLGKKLVSGELAKGNI